MCQLLETFKRAKADFDRYDQSYRGLVCKVGLMSGCPVLKLQNRAWTNDSGDEMRNRSGIFFSIWQDDESIANNRFLYNIHALKLRLLKGYSIASRDFAAEFRIKFEVHRQNWPNILTLIQGWHQFDPLTADKDVYFLIDRFVEICPIIDELLHQRRR
jgi:hypothetical protein